MGRVARKPDSARMGRAGPLINLQRPARAKIFAGRAAIFWPVAWLVGKDSRPQRSSATAVLETKLIVMAYDFIFFIYLFIKWRKGTRQRVSHQTVLDFRFRHSYTASDVHFCFLLLLHSTFRWLLGLDWAGPTY